MIPPAWRDVWISPRPKAKLQATGLDRAGRRQYLYHPDFRARQEQEKFDRLVLFAERIPDLRRAMSKHMELEPFEPEWTCALAIRLINLGWFRVWTERYAQTTRTFGFTTLRKSHVSVRGSRISFRYRGKHKVWVRTAIADPELAAAMKELLALPRPATVSLPQGRNVAQPDKCAAERVHRRAPRRGIHGQGFPDVGRDAPRRDCVRRARAGRDRNRVEARRRGCDARGSRAARQYACGGSRSYVSPAVVEQYLDGRTIEDFRPRHLRVVGARDNRLDHEERALLALLRSWRIRRARVAA